MTELNAETARRAIVEHTRRLAESAAAAGPDAAVRQPRSGPSPTWSRTVGQTQNWVGEIIERASPTPHSAHGNGRAAC